MTTDEPSLRIAANRKTRKWTRRELVGRVLWGLCSPLFALSPRPLWGWRRFMLRCFGAQVGRDAHVCSTVRFTIPWNVSIGPESAIGDRAIIYALGPITIGAQATISQGAHLCAGTHDYRFADMPLVKAPISIGSGTWICAEAFIGPQVRIGDRAIVGARAVVMKDVPADAIVAGNPARALRVRPPVK
jgi:putative colanic acid biosynthesis acetyltransferase WcaF